MHERLNSYAEFLDQPHVRETGLIQWLAQAGVAQPVPVPALPGMPAAPDGSPRGTAPVPGQHTAGHPGRARLHGAGDRRLAGARHGRGLRMKTEQKKAVVVGAPGFHDVVDSEPMFERLLRRFRREKIVP